MTTVTYVQGPGRICGYEFNQHRSTRADPRFAVVAHLRQHAADFPVQGPFGQKEIDETCARDLDLGDAFVARQRRAQRSGDFTGILAGGFP